MSAETTTVAASSASEPLPVKRNSLRASAASGGVWREGFVPERTGVAPPRETAAVLAPRMAEATVLKAAPPSSTSLARVSPGARGSESSLTPPKRHPSSAECIAGRLAAWKRPQASLRARPRSPSSLMARTAGFREPGRKSVPPNHVERPRSCATFPVLEVLLICAPLPQGLRYWLVRTESLKGSGLWPGPLPRRLLLRQEAR